MRVKEIIASKKSGMCFGEWKNGSVPKSRFPLSKTKLKRYSLSSQYYWRIIKFSINNQSFRVWVGFHPGKENFFAYLGEEQNGDMAVLAVYEFHGTHAGWHIHSACGNEADVTAGKLRDSSAFKRVPSGRSYHRRKTFNVTYDNAVDVVAKAFGLHNHNLDQKDIFYT